MLILRNKRDYRNRNKIKQRENKINIFHIKIIKNQKTIWNWFMNNNKKKKPDCKLKKRSKKLKYKQKSI